MSCSITADSIRLVGDPVDVVTGACVEVSWEFELRGPLPFVFRRHYDSGRRVRHFALGWGHSHEYERYLAFGVDGLRYTRAVAPPIPFPPLLRDGDQATAQGLRLVRIDALHYELRSSDGTTSEFVFDSPEKPAAIRSLRRGGDTIRFSYDPHGRLSSIIDSVGRFLRVDSDAGGRLLALTLITDAGRAEKPLLRFAYHETGYLASGVDAHGNTFSFDYDTRGRVIRKTDRRGYSFVYEYDDQDRCVRSYGSDGLHAVRLRYLPDERATIVTRADDGEWTYLYDETGAVTRIIDPYGGARSFEIDERGRVAKEIDPNGNEFDWVYDALGAKLGRRSPFGELLRDPTVPAVPTARGHAVPRSPIEWEYGRLLSPTAIRPMRRGDPALHDLPRPLAERVWTLAERSDDPAADAGSARREGDRSYDLTGLRILEHKAEHPPRRWLYDAGGNTRRYLDHDGAVHSYEYASWDLRSAHTDPAGNTTRYAYTGNGALASVVDAGGARTDYEYDLKNRLSRISRDGDLLEEYRYDDADNLIEKLDRDGESLLRIEIGAGNAKAARHLGSGGSHTFEYDDHGRCTKAATDEFEATFEYDALGQRIADERDGLGVRHSFRGYRVLAATTVLGRFLTTYRRAPDRSVVVRDPTGAQHRIACSKNGFVVRSLSNGTRETTQFDPDGRVRARHGMNPQTRRGWTRSYRYSGEGDLLDTDDEHAGRTRYEYDQAHRLRSVHQGASIARYSHDGGGNLLAQPGLRDVRIDRGNRIERANNETFEYGHRSSIVARRGTGGATEYTYDARDMLVRAAGAAGEWTAAYDPFGRRVWKAHPDGRTVFYWDTDRLAAEVSPEGRLRVYVYPDAFSVVPMMFVDYDRVDAAPETGTRYFVFCDHLSTPFRIEDDDGRTVWSARIAPFGRCEVADGVPIEFALRFPGHYFDAETGLHYNRFRYYDPVLGRYVQPDPIGIEAGTNLYAYARGNPLKWVDVRGDCPSGPSDTDDDPDSPEDGADHQAPAPRTGGKYDDMTIEMTGHGRSVDERYDVRIYDPAELESRRVVAGSDGRLVYASDGRPVDSGDQPLIYVMDRHGNFYVDEPKFGEVHHSSLAGGDQPAAAGEMQVIDGNVVEMNESTGHYGGDGHQPPGRVETASSEMSDQGVDMSNARTKRYGEH